MAPLDESITELGRFYIDRAIGEFGKRVDQRIQEAGRHSNAEIAGIQRIREWERLMGVDTSTSTTGFADPGDSLSAHGRRVGEDHDDDDEDIDLDD